MSDFIKEKKTVWQILSESSKSICIYGMGDGALKILNVFKKYNIKCSGIFDSGNYARGHKFAGFDVLTYNDLKEKYGDFIIIMGFAVNTDKMFNYIQELSNEHQVFSPDIPVAGDGLFDFDFIDKNKHNIIEVYNSLEDNLSKKVYQDVINFKISGKYKYLLDCQTDRKEILKNIFTFNDDEIFVDAGAYTGDTVQEFLNNVNNSYKKIFAIEPDEKNFKRLKRNVKSLNIKDIECLNIGVWSEKAILLFNNKGSRSSSLVYKNGSLVDVDSIDNILNSSPVSYIKYDVEGAEKEAILGSKESIKKFSPKLEIAAYHRNEDLFYLPLLLKQINSDYKIFLRHHPYIPAWETNIYAYVD